MAFKTKAIIAGAILVAIYWVGQAIPALVGLLK